MVVKSESVMEEILKELPCEPPEIGGILGGKNGVVTCHVLDYGKTGGSPCSYRFLEPKSLGVKPAHDGLVEIVYQCSKQKKDSILRHE